MTVLNSAGVRHVLLSRCNFFEGGHVLQVWLPLCRQVGSVAGGAFPGGGFVEKDGAAGYGPGQLVASFAADVLVRALQGKCGPLIVVEQRGLPASAVVTLGAGRDSGLGELPAVDVLVAFLTFRRRRLEVHIDQTRFLVRRFMAVHAGGGSMCAQQGKGSFRVIEA